MANNVTTIIGTVQSETEREEYLFMMECFDACEEAKQNERMLRAELKNARVKLEQLHNSRIWCGADHDTALEQIVELTLQLSQVWAEYDRLLYGQ